MKRIPYGRHWLDSNDIDEVVNILRSDWLTQGPTVKKFEEELAEYCNANYAVVFSSGTAALHASYAVSGVKDEDEVITSPITFAATSNAALYVGARPVFVDVETDTANLDYNLIEDSITPKTKAIVPIDFAGHPADIGPILDIAKKHNLVVIEDACHSMGAEYNGKRIGGISDLSVISFHPVKHITTGEGGVVLTNNEGYYKQLLMFRSHGITKDSSELHVNEGPWYHEMQLLGYNYRLTDFQSALGLSQLKKIGFFMEKCREVVSIYNEALKDYVETPVERSYAKASWHLYVIKLKDDLKRREVFETLYNRYKIGVQVHYIPVYWHPYYERLGYKKGICPQAERYYGRAITLPLFPAISDEEIAAVINAVKMAIQ